MKYTVYKTINLVNDKFYIGKHQTEDPYDAYLGSGKLLSHAIKKYGIENFKKEVLFVFDSEEEMNLKEKELVTEEFCLREDVYNLNVGGEGGFSFINREKSNLYGSNGKSGHGLENLEIGRQTKRHKMKTSKEYCDNIRKIHSDAKKKYHETNPGTFTGKVHTDEARCKIGKANSFSQSGSKNSQFGSFWITNGTESKKIKRNGFIPEGWYKGRKLIVHTTS